MGAFKGWQSTKKNNLFSGFPVNPSKGYVSYFNVQEWSFVLDCTKGLSSYGNNDPVASWTSVNSEISFTQSNVGLQPIYRTTFSPFNNFPAVDFTVNNLSTLVSSSSYSRPLNFTAAMLIVNSAFGSDRNTILCNAATASGAFISAQRSPALPGIGSLVNLTGSPVLSGVNSSSPQIVVFNQNAIIVNGVNVGSGSLDVPPAFNKIGAINGSNISGFALGFLGIIPQKLSTLEMQNLCSAMNTHFNLIY